MVATTEAPMCFQICQEKALIASYLRENLIQRDWPVAVVRSGEMLILPLNVGELFTILENSPREETFFMENEGVIDSFRYDGKCPSNRRRTASRLRDDFLIYTHVPLRIRARANLCRQKVSEEAGRCGAHATSEGSTSHDCSGLDGRGSCGCPGTKRSHRSPSSHGHFQAL